MTDEARFDIFAGQYLETLGKALFNSDPRYLLKVARVLRACSDAGGTIWLVGNGGSATLASHMATDFQLGGLRAISLTDVAAITTAANDHTYDFSFVVSLDTLAKKGDVLVAISGSGKSPNVVRATEWARGNGLTVIGVTGFKKSALSTDYMIHAPVEHMGQAQDAHQILLHIIAYWLMDAEATGA